MAKPNNVYLVVISEDKDIQVEERIKIEKEEGYINFDSVFLCVLLLNEEGDIIEPKQKYISRMLEKLKEEVEENRKIIYINLYHSKQISVENLQNYGQENIRGMVEKQIFLQFSHSNNNYIYGIIKKIMDFVNKEDVNRVVEILETQILSNPRQDLEISNRERFIDLLSKLVHKIGEENPNKAVSIIREILEDEELLEIMSDVLAENALNLSKMVLKEMENSLKNERKKEINCGLEFLNFLLKYLKKDESALS